MVCLFCIIVFSIFICLTQSYFPALFKQITLKDVETTELPCYIPRYCKSVLLNFMQGMQHTETKFRIKEK